jgi:alkylmercury lyase
MSTTKHTPAAQAFEKLIRSGGLLDYGPDRSRLLLRIVRSLGEGSPVSPEQVDQISEEIGVVRDDAHAFLRQVTEPGPDDAIIGALGLTLNETTHRFTVNGTRLFTWCALDTLFLPTVLGQPASIESESPVSRTKVQLKVGPQGVEAVDRPGVAVSIVLLDPDAAEMNSVEAIWTAFCHHVFFFATRDEADAWAAGRANRDAIEIVSVDEAFRLGHLLSSTVLTQARER